jgi:hypothetical protein
LCDAIKKKRGKFKAVDYLLAHKTEHFVGRAR